MPTPFPIVLRLLAALVAALSLLASFEARADDADDSLDSALNSALVSALVSDATSSVAEAVPVPDPVAVPVPALGAAPVTEPSSAAMQEPSPAPVPAPPDATSDAPHLESLPTAGMLTAEPVHLSGGERMGLVGGALQFDIGGDWGIGPAVYGAVTGRRGGLFVGGVEVQRRWGLGGGFSLATGLFAGGGGGAGAAVGSGLMLRPAVTVFKDFGQTFQLGLSFSSVRFPSGDIHSNQIGLALGWHQEFMHFSGSGAIPNASALPSAGLGFDRIAATASTYRLRGDDTHKAGLLIGARAERRTGLRGFTWGIESAAAARGNAAGYMEVLATAAYSVAPLDYELPSWRVGARVAGGAGGGGAIPTGGGLLGKAALTTEISPYPGWTVGADYGIARSRNGSFRASEAKAWLSLDLEPGLNSRTAAAAHVARTEWVATLQHHPRIPRTDGTARPLDTIGLKLNRYLGDHVYVSGQAHSAFAGSAGAYSVGLVGLGVSAAPLSTVRVGIEALGGAAGGGGVTNAGGAIAQTMAWAAWQPGRVGEFRAGIGATRTVHGGHTGPVMELSWGRAFGMAAR